MKIRAGETEIQLSIFIFVLPPLLIIAGFLREYTAAFFSIILHELGHMTVAYFYGYKPGCIKITPIGFSLSINDSDCPRKTLIKIYSAGPVVNLLIFVVLSLVTTAFPAMKGYLDLLSTSNIYLGIFNLLPVYPLDGGRILLEVMAGSIGTQVAGRMLRVLTLILSTLMLLLGAYQLYVSAFNFSLIVIGLYIIISLRIGRMESAIMNIKQIIYRRSRLMKKGIYPARDLVVIKSTQLSETLKNMDFDRFHIVYVLDNNLRLLRVFTENEIIDAMIGGDNNMTFEQLIELPANLP